MPEWNAILLIVKSMVHGGSGGAVGAFEGAHYFHCDAYRPEFRCRMRDLGQPFCAVCQRRIR